MIELSTDLVRLSRRIIICPDNDGLANIAAGVQDVTNKVGKLLESLSR